MQPTSNGTLLENLDRALVRDLFRRLRRPRDPKLGEIWSVDNADLGIPLRDPPTHPVVVIREAKHPGLPVTIAPGSSSFQPSADEIALVVDPGDAEPEGAIEKHTRFRMTDNRRLAPEKLRRKKGRLTDPKRQEMLMLRQRIH